LSKGEVEEKAEEVKAEIVERPEYRPPMAKLLRPVASVDEIVDAWKEYQELCHKLLDKNDYCTIQGKEGRCYRQEYLLRRPRHIFPGDQECSLRPDRCTGIRVYRRSWRT